MLRFLAWIVCRIFFKKISVSGAPYAGGSAIWAANHTSGIVDPAVIIGLAPVSIRPLAKHTLWNTPIIRQLLMMSKAIPVNRLNDLKKDLQAEKEMLDLGHQEQDWRSKSNSEAFQAVGDALLAGDCILIFPEGVSHDDPFIYQLKTGLARMALQAISRSNDENFHVVVQPVIIDYAEKDEFRSELCLHFCEPLVIRSTDYSVKDITSAVRKSLEDGLASFFTWDEKRNWQCIFEISYGRPYYSPLEFRNFVEKFRPYFDADPVLLGKIQTMRRLLQAINISPSQLVWGDINHKKSNFFWVLFRQGWFYFCITLPIQFLGAIVWIIPAKVCELLARKSTVDRDVRATMKISHGLWFFPLWAFFMSWLFTELLGAYLPDYSKVLLWVAFLVLTPTFFVLSLLVAESMNFFPGFLRLVRLRFFFPRGWFELLKEWREISNGVLHKVESDSQ